MCSTPALTVLSISCLNQAKSKSWSFFCSSLLIALICQESAEHSYIPGTTSLAVAATVFFLETATISTLVQLSDLSPSMEETWDCACHHHATASPRELKCTLVICHGHPPASEVYTVLFSRWSCFTSQKWKPYLSSYTEKEILKMGSHSIRGKSVLNEIALGKRSHCAPWKYWLTLGF